MSQVSDRTATIVDDPWGTPPEHVPIEKVLGRIQEVSTLPHIALRVIEVARDPDSGVSDLRAIVEGDPSLSARMLRCANSAAYGLRTKVSNLQQAISFMGFDQVRNLAITASVADVFKSQETIGTYRRPALWKHLVVVGLCARMLAKRQRLANFDDAFLAGLLHDIGIVLIDQHCHEPFCAMIEALRQDRTLVDAEQHFLGFDHTTLGARVAEAWRFPPAAVAAIRFHHMSQNHRGDHSAIIRCVEIANVVCTLKDITSVGMRLTRLPVEALAAMQLGKEDIKVLAGDLDHEIVLNRHLMDL